MKPILSKNNGFTRIGVLDETLSCTVTEERNGEYTASFTYPYTGSLYSQLVYDNLINVKANQKSEDLQKFRIVSVSKPINGIVTCGCEHISYELNKNPVMVARSFGGEDGKILADAGMMLNYIFANAAVGTPFYGVSDITEEKKCELDFISVREAILKVQQYFGGELEWDNQKVILHRFRGIDSGLVISYGNNLLDYTQKIDVSSVYTAIAPYARLTDENGDKKAYFLPEKYLTYYNADDYTYIRAQAVDFSDEFTEEELESFTDDKGILSDGNVISSLRNKAQKYMNDNFYADIIQNVTLSYVDLRKAKEFETIQTMNDLGLCDYVTLRDSRMGVDYRAKVVMTKFNVLTEMYDSIEIGRPRDNLIEALASIVNLDENKDTIGETVEKIEQNLDEYFSEIKVTDNKIVFKSGNIKNIEGVYNSYTYKISRDSDIQELGKRGRIVSIIDPKNRKTKIVREE
ncbi:MAG: phage tail protein [Ruminococcus sp.]|nr:phage tail protein [Ruminococcus sp.]MCM1380339.1 phage tail protein [Muribaculaceae bacterium]MCM1478251.1 phage tail protein [Muribaculaceae bacterium]